MIDICPPALIYLIFSTTQIILDIFKGLYNTAFFKFIVMIMITLLLNALCQQGLSIISWFIVFIPFILMSVIVTMLLYVFGLDIATGQFDYNCQNTQPTTTTTATTTKNVVVIPDPFVKIFNPNNSAPTNTSTNTYPYPYYPPPTAAEVNNYNNIAPVNQTQQAAVQATIFPPNYSSSPEYSS
jgi:hypothetical protein